MPTGRIWVTGSTGFLGRTLVNRLREEGVPLLLTSRSQARVETESVLGRSLDLTVASDFQRIEKVPITAIVHAAGCIPPRGRDRELAAQVFSTNVIGTLNLLEFARERAVPQVVYCSSMAVYARFNPLPVTEEMPTYPTEEPVYGASKLAGEALCESARERRDVECFSLRFPYLYGLGMETDRLIPRFIAGARAGQGLEVWGGAAASVDCLYVKDAVAAIWRALQAQSRGGVFNVGCGREIPIREVAEAVRAIFGTSSLPIQLRTDKPGRRFWMDISRARKELGFEPAYTLIQGLNEWREAMAGREMAPAAGQGNE